MCTWYISFYLVVEYVRLSTKICMRQMLPTANDDAFWEGRKWVTDRVRQLWYRSGARQSWWEGRRARRRRGTEFAASPDPPLPYKNAPHRLFSNPRRARCAVVAIVQREACWMSWVRPASAALPSSSICNTYRLLGVVSVLPSCACPVVMAAAHELG
jgi:hypothetical protein